MKRILVTFLLADTVLAYSQSQERLFELSFSKLLHSETTSSYRRMKGPYFLDSENCIVLDEMNRLFQINIPFDKSEQIKYEQAGEPFLYRIGSQVYLKTEESLLLIQGKDLIDSKGVVRLDTGLFFSFRHGVYRKKGYGIEGVISKEEFLAYEDDSSYEPTHLTAPALDSSKSKIIYLSPDKGNIYKLVIYDLRKGGNVVTINNVLWFAPLPAYPDYILLTKLSINEAGEPALVSYMIVNIMNGNMVKNLPDMEFSNNSRFFITNFDINRNNELLAQLARFPEGDQEPDLIHRDISIFKMKKIEK